MTAASDAAFYRLMSWLSPSFPVGAFTYSHGIEYAVEAGLLRDRAALVGWLCDLLEFGSGRNDAILFKLAWSAAADDEAAALDEVLDWAAALRPTSELALESAAQGEAFLRAVRAAWPHPALEALAARIVERAVSPAYPVVVAVTAACHAVPLNAALSAFLHGFVANLISAAVRLVPLGQTDGQIALAALARPVAETACVASSATLADLGGAAAIAEFCSAAHETQYTRLFRS
ncbi:MAG TPA: urease accessory protein UreF [Alphaproteobacteria bacterium]|nr:urease accessory protein UreF [Alphaproteobacteria bacterium]HBC52923.1 urease accessory protein UreF [Alphaproteobacteria bacterium]